jgi:hypothetical protein
VRIPKLRKGSYFLFLEPRYSWSRGGWRRSPRSGRRSKVKQRFNMANLTACSAKMPAGSFCRDHLAPDGFYLHGTSNRVGDPIRFSSPRCANSGMTQ